VGLAQSPLVTPRTDVLGSNELWGPDWVDVRAHWDLDPTRAHLNHGSFGAVPRRVRSAQAEWRGQVDSNPMGFFRLARRAAVAEARLAAADFLSVDPASLALVSNATAGVSTVLAALRLRPGDEVMITDHAYGAVRIAATRFAESAGGQVVTAGLPLTAADDEVVAALADHITPATRVVVLDQVSSPTARLFPVRQVAELTRAHGAALLVDGAHVPGMLDPEIESSGADFWVGNFHKWAFAAHSVAGLWVAPAWRHTIRPLVASWSESEPYPACFDQQGTLDDSAWLSLPVALDFYRQLGVDRLRNHNATLAAHAQSVVAAALGVQAPPGSDDVPQSMRLVPLPHGTATAEDGAAALYERIAAELRTEVAVVRWSGRAWLRLSAQVYNRPADYERLAAGLPALL
jgi:isopenicillin-N epimerase